MERKEKYFLPSRIANQVRMMTMNLTLPGKEKRNLTIPQGKMEIKEKGLLPSQIANQVRMKRMNSTLSGRKETDLIVL